MLAFVSCGLIQLAEIRRPSQHDQLIAVFHDGSMT